MGDKSILIERTSKRLKRWELIVTATLFLTLIAGFGLLYVAVFAAVAAWSLTAMCFFCVRRGADRHLVESSLNEMKEYYG